MVMIISHLGSDCSAEGGKRGVINSNDSHCDGENGDDDDDGSRLVLDVGY